MEEKMIFGLANDHAGFELKGFIKAYLEGRGFKYKDFGTYSSESCDYPDFAHPLAEAIEKGEVGRGIAFCGTGNGMAMALNKHPKVRAGICWMPEIAKLISAHNNANVLVIPARFIMQDEVEKILEAYIDTPFEGGRHQKRVDKICLDKAV